MIEKDCWAEIVLDSPFYINAYGAREKPEYKLPRGTKVHVVSDVDQRGNVSVESTDSGGFHFQNSTVNTECLKAIEGITPVIEVNDSAILDSLSAIQTVASNYAKDQFYPVTSSLSTRQMTPKEVEAYLMQFFLEALSKMKK
jgi:hypothetical protein